MEHLLKKPVESAVELLGLPSSLAGRHVHVFMSLVALVIVIFVSFLVWRRLRSPERNLLPDQRPTFANVAEITVSAILRLMDDVMGKGSASHLPLVAGLFIYIMICNTMSIIPGMQAPTENINTNLAMAGSVFVYYNYVGIKNQGLRKYLKHLAGPVIWLAPLMFAIELVSHIVRPVSLSVRLFGNMLGDHVVYTNFSDIAPFVIPVLFMIMAIFVSFIQAFVFVLLSMIYISLASKGPLEEN
jgi:F-type H+-transporting ATPase subunit a